MPPHESFLFHFQHPQQVDPPARCWKDCVRRCRCMVLYFEIIHRYVEQTLCSSCAVYGVK